MAAYAVADKANSLLRALTTMSRENRFAPIRREVIAKTQADQVEVRRSITTILSGAFSLTQRCCLSAYPGRPDMRSQPKQRGAGQLQTNLLC